jgi:uncharacterized SAM-binding protein YcdF (DUF218 family)
LAKSKFPAPRRRGRAWWLAAAAILLLALIFHRVILAAIGSYLVQAASPERADLVVVLGGDSYGDRVRKAAELVREGYAPRVLVSGASGFYGVHECDLAIPYAVKAGYPESYFLHAEHDARSTEEEARSLLPFLSSLGARRVLLVTSDYHTRRSGRLFRAAAPAVQFIVVAARGPEFSPDAWWRSRQGRKIALLEWLKTVAGWVGL